ncbi:hypothetical protein [Petrachloros mirabilis]
MSWLTASSSVRAFVLLVMGGCSGLSPMPPKSQPYFIVDTGEAKILHSMAKKQEVLLAKCGERNTCDHAYFTRALIGLYESREVAAKYFGKVINLAPRGQLAAPSRIWLRLLQVEPAPMDRSWFNSVIEAPAISDGQATLGKAADLLVRDLLEKEMALQQLRVGKDADTKLIEVLQRELIEQEREVESLLGKKEQIKASTDPVTVQSLQKQLTERDKKIEELTNQLEALKRIDQEMREKVRPIRPPSSVVTPPMPEMTNP